MSTVPTHWFVADTHFCESRPEHIDAFTRLCQLPKAGDSLLLLGDIFEIWIGDDLARPSDVAIEEQLLALTQRGVKLFLMHGNRDFMLGPAFAKRTGCKLINDPTKWVLPNGQEALLTHGDWFCTDEVGYRRFRRISRNKLFQFLFKCLPSSRRKNIANKIRANSIAAHKRGGNRSYDANAGLIQQWFNKYSPINTIIMGHTHLPNLHQQQAQTRLVLGDWRDTLWYAKASAENGVQLFEADLKLTDAKLRFQFD
ncbi:UDP-2,3-diacylglucosamine diphosphatase [Agaribacterium sp. ZY112]|uniref:UDP-2,3-diacylglucosamine diphosphatase n=1 Tax=Agaribacterium sp. ZY112 TaxID=3233574 RepID=UPI003524CAC6